MMVSIKNKLIIGYVLICFLSLGILNVFIVKTIKADNREIITNELKVLKERTENYTENYIETIVNYNTEPMDDILHELRIQLSRYYNEYNIVYDSCDKKVSSFHPDINVDELVSDSMSNLKKNIISYDINYLDNNVIVDFPITLKYRNSKIGTVRYFIDYTNLINIERKIQSIIFYFSFFLGILVVILSIVNSNRIVNSILKFKDFVEQIGDNNSNEMLDVTSQDEIGQLASNINLMKKRITMQIKEIKDDKRKIENISNYRKQFYENMTHELKTPLTTIMGYTELSLYEKVYNEDYLKIVNEESNRLFKLVTSILDMSYYGRDDIYRDTINFRVDELIIDVVSKMNLKAQKYNVNLLLHNNEILEIKGNKEGIKTILINLIDNSIKYNTEHGNIVLSSFVNASTWVLIVEDNGIGISDNDKTQIFKPFYRNSSVQSDMLKSSGLGLAIVKEIIDFHEGLVDVESTLGKGTKITIKIPLL